MTEESSNPALNLADRDCVPGTGDEAPLRGADIQTLLNQLDAWEAVDEQHLRKTFLFPDFSEALVFVNRIGAIAEACDHHPDLHLAWGRVRVKIWTHVIDGLTESDFIFAAKCDREYS